MADLDFANADLVYPLGTREEWLTVVTETEAGGLGIRRQKWGSPRYRFRLRFSFGSRAAWATFQAFFAARKGGLQSFTWTHPQETVVYACRFASDGVSVSEEGPEEYEAEVELVAVKT